MELIDKQAAINEFCHSCDEWSCNPNTCCKTEWIRKLPPIQPKKGKWIKDANKWMCDKCGELVMDDDHNFCPNCGADMREVTT